MGTASGSHKRQPAWNSVDLRLGRPNQPGVFVLAHVQTLELEFGHGRTFLKWLGGLWSTQFAWILNLFV